MATPTKTIPEIPEATAVAVGDQFLVRIAGPENPERVDWQTLLSMSLSSIPPELL